MYKKLFKRLAHEKKYYEKKLEENVDREVEFGGVKIKLQDFCKLMLENNIQMTKFFEQEEELENVK